LIGRRRLTNGEGLASAGATRVIRPVVLSVLEAEGDVACIDREIVFDVRPDWVVEGEDRVGYAGIIQLIECTRELHERLDIALPAAHLAFVTRTLKVDFLSPLHVGGTASASYRVCDVGRASYSLEVTIRDRATMKAVTIATIVLVLVDSRMQPKAIDSVLCDRLRMLSENGPTT